ncbi:psbP domain-containing protein 7, chloroplastic [Syzygium oleosum]|uniref:psbP domain-containing protein 7, chloroplastic n=1 Tax=Syzygium oleosum TaxID=219896 RepID=UPI0011D2949F|nr:psbP domain-containing protein 7, chloroplastic [Syzygium oleosum]
MVSSENHTPCAASPKPMLYRVFVCNPIILAHLKTAKSSMLNSHYHMGCRFQSLRRIHTMARSNDDPEESFRDASMRPRRSPAEQFAPLALTFRRRILIGVGSASLVALGANFAGITSSILGLLPETGRDVKLDVLYPIKGYSRCIDTNEGFEFIYPANWVGDQTLLYRAVGKAELERGLDPPPLNRRRQNVNEPTVAFGPPGTNGELNVSVIVSKVPLNFSIESFGGPEEVGEAIVQTIVGSSRRPDVKGSLVKSTLREDPSKMVKYYELEFRVESPSFQRHNIAVCCTRQGKLYTLNAQAPELAWPEVKSDLYTIAESFVLTS